MTVNLNWINIIIALIVGFTPFGIAQVKIYSDVQIIKDKQEILFEYKDESKDSKDYALNALHEILFNQKALIKEAEEQKLFREKSEQKDDDFYQLNPQLKRPR